MQNVQLLSGKAPVVSMEQLIYDCRLMNRARQDGRKEALQLRNWLADSDAPHDPQAFVLTPEATIRFAERIVEAPDSYRAGCAVAREAVGMMREGLRDKRLRMRPAEARYLDLIDGQLDDMPDNEGDFIAQMLGVIDRSKVNLADYDLRE